MSTTTTQYPLLFGFQERIFGTGFVASVAVRGRAVAEQESEGVWWVYGVTPGALAGTGASLNCAVTAFRERMKSVFVDCAEEAVDFVAFQSAAEKFFHATDDDAEKEWDSARLAVKSGQIDYPELSKDRSVQPPTIAVGQLAITPSANVVDNDEPCLAA